jgi:hypothetical protein
MGFMIFLSFELYSRSSLRPRCNRTVLTERIQPTSRVQPDIESEAADVFSTFKHMHIENVPELWKNENTFCASENEWITVGLDRLGRGSDNCIKYAAPFAGARLPVSYVAPLSYEYQ